jgi:hypothetical protein
VESEEQVFFLVERGEVKLDLKVSSARAFESGVKIFRMVSGHEQDSAFLRSDSVKSVEEAGERYASSLAFTANLRTSHEETVDIFKEND